MQRVRVRPKGGVYVYRRRRAGELRWIVERRRGVGLPKSYKVFPERAAAEEYATKLRLDIALQESIVEATVDSKITLDDAWAAYSRVAVRKLRHGTMQTYAGAMRKHVLPALGHLTLAELTRERVRTYIKEALAAGQDAKTLRNSVGVLRSCLASYVDDGILPSNPAALGRGLIPVRHPDPKSLTRPDLNRFLEAARKEPHYDLILFLALTGVRLGEALALRWEDVHLAERRAVIRRSVRLSNEGAPKTRFGLRPVDLAAPLVRALEARLATRTGASPLVFPSSTGRYVNARHLLHVFGRVSARAALPPVHPHMLRHTWATVMLNGGAPLNYVSRALGHHSTAFTASVYATANPDPRLAEVDALAAAALDQQPQEQPQDALRPVIPDPPVQDGRPDQGPPPDPHRP